MNASTFYKMFVVLIIFFLLSLYFFHPIPLQGTNVDLGHHLLLGKITVESMHVPQTNLISYTHPDYVFVNTQWLSEVVFYFWHSWFGFGGLIVLSVLLAVKSFFFVFSHSLKKYGTLPTFLVSLLSFQIIIDRTELKPELFSFVFLSFFLFVLYKYKEKYTKLIFLLPLLEALWINFHIFFVVGIVVVLSFLLDILVTNKWKLKTKNDKTLLLVTLITLLSTLINPNLIKGVLYPFFVLSNYGYDVIENKNILSALPHADITFIYFLINVALLWGGIILYRKKVRRVDILLSSFFTFMAFFAVRHFPLYVFGTFIPLVCVTSLALKQLQAKTKEATYQTLVFVVCLFAFVGCLPAVYWNFKTHGVGFGVIDNAKEAMSFFKVNQLKGPIYNNYNIGNYIEYQLYPKERVFVDGNPEQYPEEFFKDVYYPSENNFDVFQKVSNSYKFNTVIYEHKNQTLTQNPLLLGLAKSEDWKMVYLSSSLVMFVKNTNDNKEVIKNYQITQENVKLNSRDTSTSDKVGDLSNFFKVIGWYDKMMEMDLKYLNFKPKDCTALRHVAALMQQKKDSQAMLYLADFQKNCMK